MKTHGIHGFAISLLMAGHVATAATPTPIFHVTPEQMAPEPISPVLYGNFIELGYGLQTDSMWSEMFFNRSFEPFPSYKHINVEWFDLWLDPKDPAKGYKTDWSKEDWYHSGYEHNTWFAAPGNGGPVPIDEKSTFMIATTPLAKVQLRRQAGGSGHGVQQLRVANNEPRTWAGVAQGGKYLRKGVTYRFRGMLKAINKPVKAEIRLYPEGDWKTPIVVIPLKETGNSWAERIVRIPNKNFTGRATFALWLPPESEMALDDFSLMPMDNVNGWRADIIDPLKRVAPSVIRFPGGCFASFYDWRDGIGDPSTRQPQPSYFWGGLNNNDVGVAEYAGLCRKIGAEMMWCVNMYHPMKAQYEWFWNEAGPAPGKHGYEFAKFSDLEQGATDAAALVAYCNGRPGSHPMADLRAKHGYPLPFGIKYWELDNEAHRWFEPEEYARAAVLYSKAMKAVDPSIKIGLETYGYRLDTNGQQRVVFQDAIPQMLEIAGKNIDYLADRGPADKEYLGRVIALLTKFNSENKTSIKYSETEKLFNEPNPNLTTPAPVGGLTKSFMFSKWHYAMNVLKNYMAYQKAGGDVETVIFNNLANTHNQSVINTPKEGVFLSASGVAMSALAHSSAAWPLQFEGYEAKVSDDFQVSAAWDKNRKRLVLYVLNRTGNKRDACFNYERLERRFERARQTTLTADGPLAMNTLANPLAIKHNTVLVPVPRHETSQTVVVEPWSFAEVVLE